MPRTRIVVWTYTCDATTPDGRSDCWREYSVGRGDQVSTGRGTVVHDQADADAAARTEGWKVASVVLCPVHVAGGGVA